MKAIIQTKPGCYRKDIEKLVGKVQKTHISLDRLMVHEPANTSQRIPYVELCLMIDGETIVSVLVDPGELEKAIKAV